jgi:hypothetical protein
MIIRIKRSSGNITMFKGDIGCKHLVFVIVYNFGLMRKLSFFKNI